MPDWAILHLFASTSDLLQFEIEFGLADRPRTFLRMESVHDTFFRKRALNEQHISPAFFWRPERWCDKLSNHMRERPILAR